MRYAPSLKAAGESSPCDLFSLASGQRGQLKVKAAWLSKPSCMPDAGRVQAMHLVLVRKLSGLGPSGPHKKLESAYHSGRDASLGLMQSLHAESLLREPKSAHQEHPAGSKSWVSCGEVWSLKGLLPVLRTQRNCCPSCLRMIPRIRPVAMLPHRQLAGDPQTGSSSTHFAVLRKNST